MADTFDQMAAHMGGGLYSLLLLDCVSAVPMLESAVSGNAEADAYLWIIRRFLARCRTRPARLAPSCLACNSKLRPQRLPLIIVVALRTGSDLLDAVIAGLCRDCGLRAGWPEPNWRARLGDIVRPVIEDLWSDASAPHPG